MTSLTFLGTGGARYATIFQARATGGIYIEAKPKISEEPLRIHLDPGPGAIVRMKEQKIDPTKLDLILISHRHPDHYCDTEVLIEAMTRGGQKKRGRLVASESVLSGLGEDYTSTLPKYHQSMLEEVIVAKQNEKLDINGLLVEVTPAYHTDPSTVGFKIHAGEGVIGYTSDTELKPEVLEAYRGSRLLLLCVTRPLNSRIPYHLCTEDAAEIVRAAKPELAVITHFGLKVIRENPWIQAGWIQKETGVKTIPAKDWMRIELGEKIEVREKKKEEKVVKQKTLW